MSKLTGLGFVLLLAACDPGQGVSYTITPPGPSAVPDSVRSALAGITTALAERYGLLAEPQGVVVQCYAREHDMEPAQDVENVVSLRLCRGMASTGGLRVWVSEVITPQWSALGDSLRRHLGDTLQVRFGRWLSTQ